MFVLPASDSSIAPGRAAPSWDGRWIAGLAAGILIYTLLVGWGLIGGIIPLDRAYWLLALPCLAPVAWYSYGFLKVTQREQDYGLLLSAVGWALFALMFLIKHNELLGANQAAPPGTSLATVANSTADLACAALGFLCLLAGGLLSWSGSRNPAGDAVI